MSIFIYLKKEKIFQDMEIMKKNFSNIFSHYCFLRKHVLL